jgi:ubiquitin
MNGEPEVKKTQTNYPTEFLEALKADAKKFEAEGESQEAIKSYIDQMFLDYDNSLLKNQPEEPDADTPDWFEKSSIELKNDKKKVNYFRRSVAGMEEAGWNPLKKDFWQQSDVDQESDIITQEMVADIDASVRTMLDDNGDRDLSINPKDHYNEVVSEINSKHNTDDSKRTRKNIELLADEAYSEYVTAELEQTLATIAEKDGVTLRDFLFLDPEAIESEKDRWRSMGFNGYIVDRAFEKALYNDKRELMYDHYENTIVKHAGGKKEYEAKKERYDKYIKDSAVERATDLFGKQEVERLEQVAIMNQMIENGASEEEIAEQRRKIESISKRETKKAITTTTTWGTTTLHGTYTDTEKYTTLYDENGHKIMRGGESKEEIAKEKTISQNIEALSELVNMPERLYQEMIKSEMVLRDIEEEKGRMKATFFNNTEWMKHAGAEEKKKQIRRMDQIDEYRNHELARFEAVSRMYLLNENVALQDKNARNYAEDAIATLRDVNITRKLIETPNPSTEQVRDVVREVYQDMDIPLDSKEYEATEYDVTKEIVRGGTHLTDMAVKMLVIDKVAAAGGVTQFVNLLSKTGKYGKVAAGFTRLAIEEGKFRVIGGNAGTGAAFYVAQKGIPTVRTGNKALDVVWNGFVKGSVGMTASMEGVLAMEKAYDALAKDKDMVRELESEFGNLTEVQRRVMVELITAAPFGIKGMAERGAFHKANAKSVESIAKSIEATNPEAAGELRMTAAQLGGSKVMQEMYDFQHKLKTVKEENKYDPKMEKKEIDKVYKEIVEERGFDPLNHKKAATATEEYFNPKVAFDAIEYAGRVEFLNKNGISTKNKTENEINKIVDVIKEQVNPETVDGVDTVEPVSAKPYEQRPSEVSIKSVKTEVGKRIKKDTNWEKNIKEPSKRVEETVSEVKKKVGEDRFDQIVEKYSGLEGEPVDLEKKAESKHGKEVTDLERYNELKELVHGEEGTRGRGDYSRKTALETLTKMILREGRSTKEYVDWVKDNYMVTLEPKLEKLGVESEAKAPKDYAVNEFNYLVSSLKDSKTKSEYLEKLSKIEDVIHKVEVETRPEADKLEFVTRQPNEGSLVTTEMKTLRHNIAAYKRGSKDYKNAVNELHDLVKSKLTRKMVEVIKKSDINKLFKKLKTDMTDAEMAKTMQDIDVTLRKLNTAVELTEANKTVKKSRIKVKAGERKGQNKLDYVNQSKMETADILMNNKEAGAANAITKLNAIKSLGLEKGSYRESLVDAQLEALKYVGARDMAVNRQDALERLAKERKLTMTEKMEYELLNFVDSKRMTLEDARQANKTAQEIYRTGRLISEAQHEFNSARRQIDIENGLKALNISAEELRRLELTGKLDTEMNKFLKGLKDWDIAHDSFKSLMERLSKGDPNRGSVWEGHLHTFADDFYRAREAEMNDYHKTLNDIRTVYEKDVYGFGGDKLDKVLSNNKKKTYELPMFVEGKYEPSRKFTVDQVARFWQLTHNPSSWKKFQNMGWGIDAKNESKKIGEKEIKELRKVFADFIVKHGGKGSLKAAEWQMNELYPRLYAEANDMYLRKHGVDLGYTYHYVPEVFEKNVLYDAEGKEISNATYKDIIEGGSEFMVANVAPSFTKASAKQSGIKYDVKLGSEQILNDYLRKLKHYTYFQEPIDRAKQFFNDPTIRKAITYKTKTPNTIKVIDKMLGDISLDMAQGMKLPLLTTVKNRFVVANLGANLILFPKQMMSVSAYRAGLKGSAEQRAFSKYMTTGFVGGFGTMKALNKSEFLQNRKYGNSFNRDLLEAETKANQLYKAGKLNPNNIRDQLLIMTKLGDRGAILAGGQAFFRAKFDTFKKQGMSDKNARQAAYEEFVKWSKLTQQSGHMEDLGAIQRWGTIGKYATLFQNTPQQYYRIEAAAMRNFYEASKGLSKAIKSNDAEGKKKNKAIMNRSLRNLMVYHFILPMTFRAASQGFYFGGDEKGKESFTQDSGQLIAALLGSYSYFYGLGGIARNAASQITTGFAFDDQIGGVAQDVVTGFQETLKATMEKSAYEDYEVEMNRILDGTSPLQWSDVMNAVGTASEFFGIPGTSLANLGYGMNQYFSGKTDDPRALVGYSPSVMGKYNRSPQYNAMKPYLDNGKVDDFLKHMRATTDFDYYNRNEDRWIREFRMYEHFGAYNQDVNYLYYSAKNNTDRAKFLVKLRDGKVLPPITIDELERVAFEPTMSESEWKGYVNELLQYGVISAEVVKEIVKIDQKLGRKMTETMRKSAE